MKKKLRVSRITISNLGLGAMNGVRAGAGTHYCSEVCSEGPDCDTRNDCGVTYGPYACPTINAVSCYENPCNSGPVGSDKCPDPRPPR